MIQTGRKQAGYTLIEILVVMVIISIVGSVALLTMSHNRNTRYRDFTSALTTTLNFAEQQSLLTSNLIGLMMTSNGFQFYTYHSTHDASSPWQVITTGPLQPRIFPSHTYVKLAIQGVPVTLAEDFSHPAPQIVFSTNGDVTPFTLSIGASATALRYQIVGNLGGEIASGAYHAY